MNNKLEIHVTSEVDEFQLKVMEMNRYPGILPFQYREGLFTFEIAGYISLEEYLQQHTITVHWFKTFFENFLGILEDSLLYYLEWLKYSISKEHIFISLDGKQMKMIYLPVSEPQMAGCPVKALLFRELFPLAKFNREENWSFLMEGITAMNCLSYEPGKLDVLVEAFRINQEAEKLAKPIVEEVHGAVETKKETSKEHKKIDIGSLKRKLQTLAPAKKTTKNKEKKSEPGTEGTVLLKQSKAMLALLPKEEGYPKIYLEEKSLVIGRSNNGVDILIKEKSIGKLHAEVIYDGKGYAMRDLNSLNGTFLNGIKIQPYEMHSFKIGDHISFSQILYEVKNL